MRIFVGLEAQVAQEPLAGWAQSETRSELRVGTCANVEFLKFVSEK